MENLFAHERDVTPPFSIWRHLVLVLFMCALMVSVLVWTTVKLPMRPSMSFSRDVCVTTNGALIAPHPYAAFANTGIHAPRALPEKARCAVCGMYPAHNARWAAQLIYADGATHFFDSPADLLRFAGDRGRFDPDRADQPVAARYVSDFDGAGWLAVERAVFVADSDALGPMRVPDLPAFATAEAARNFIQAHGGHVVAFALLQTVPGGHEDLHLH